MGTHPVVQPESASTSTIATHQTLSTERPVAVGRAQPALGAAAPGAEGPEPDTPLPENPYLIAEDRASKPTQPSSDAKANKAGVARAEAKDEAFDQQAAARALRLAERMASSCLSKGGTATGRVAVAFAPSGAVIGVSLTGAVSSPQIAACVRSAFERVRVPAFTGKVTTVGMDCQLQR